MREVFTPKLWSGYVNSEGKYSLTHTLSLFTNYPS